MRAHVLAALLPLASPLFPAQLAVPAANQQAQTRIEEQSVVTLKQNVRNVVIDVVVTDRHGQFVKSLDKSRFEVLENGIPQDISFFEEHSAGDEAAKPSGRSAPELPPDVYTNVEAVPNDGPLMVLLLDALNTEFADLSYVRSQMLDYLKQIPAGTHIAIFTLSDKLQLIQGFTEDPAILQAVIGGKAYPPVALAQGAQATALSQDVQNDQRLASNIAATRATLSRFRTGSEKSLDHYLKLRRVEITFEALDALAEYLNGIPGRKSLIWFTGSVPWSVYPGLPPESLGGSLDYSQDVKLLVDLMTAGRVSVYPVDARGLVTPPGFSASSSGQVGHIGAQPNAFGNAEMKSQMQLGSEHGEMENLAMGTGGHAFFNNNDLRGAVVKIQSIGENYYTLAYSPKDKRYDGSFRRVEVKVSDPDVKLEYRRGYFADDPARVAGLSPNPNSNALRAAMKRGAPNSTELAFHVQVKIATDQPDRSKPSDRLSDNPAALKGQPVVRYVFNWTVDLHDVRFTSHANGMHRSEVDATLAAYNADGKLLNSIFGVARLDLNDSQYTEFLESGFPLQQVFDIPAGLVFLRAGLLDPSNGRTGATEFPLTVQALKTRVARPTALDRH